MICVNFSCFLPTEKSKYHRKKSFRSKRAIRPETVFFFPLSSYDSLLGSFSSPSEFHKIYFRTEKAYCCQSVPLQKCLLV